MKNKKPPKKFRVDNELIEIDYSFRTKLEELSDEEAIELLKRSVINGREGFFCLKSNKDLTLEKALEIYREKDSIEKIFESLKMLSVLNLIFTLYCRFTFLEIKREI